MFETREQVNKAIEEWLAKGNKITNLDETELPEFFDLTALAKWQLAVVKTSIKVIDEPLRRHLKDLTNVSQTALLQFFEEASKNRKVSEKNKFYLECIQKSLNLGNNV